MLRKNEDGFASIDLRQVDMVDWIGKPFDAFSMIARSMMVISGHVNAPAVAALATSTPRRFHRSFVFHCDLDGVGESFLAHFAVAVADGGVAPDTCSTVAMLNVFCTASPVILGGNYV